MDPKDPDIHVPDGWMPAKKPHTPSMHHPRKQNMTTSMVGLKKRSHAQKSHQKWWTPEIKLGMQKKKKTQETLIETKTKTKTLKDMKTSTFLCLKAREDTIRPDHSPDISCVGVLFLERCSAAAPAPAHTCLVMPHCIPSRFSGWCTLLAAYLYRAWAYITAMLYTVDSMPHECERTCPLLVI